MNEEHSQIASQAFCYAVDQIRNQVEILICKIDRPSVIYRPKLSLDGNYWIALYGDNIQEGVVGLGESPDEAMFHFDKEWEKRIKAKGTP
jgi:hypothetical protein